MSETKEKIMKYLREQYGVENIDFEIRDKENEKLYAFKKCEDIDIGMHGHFNGLYFGKLCKDGLRLSIEGSFLIGRIAKYGVIDVNREEAERWLSGENLKRKEKGYVILRWRSYYMGCGKGNGEIIKNFVPKERRLTHGDKRVSEKDV